MARSILVTGGTGTLGSLVVRHLLDAGSDVRVLSRHALPGEGYAPVAVDLRDGAGLDTAVEGAHTIIHCATTLRGGDIESARNLIEAAKRAGVEHLVYISIVGIDRLPLGYYRTKLAVERLIENSGLRWTILRTTQFHDLVARFCRAQARLPVLLIPAGISVQPIHTDEVAARLAELGTGEPAWRVPDWGGPEVRGLDELARAYLRSAGRRRPVLRIRLPGKVSRGYREGRHLTPERAVGKITFDEFLAGTH
ncbi:MAG: NAD(P)H-binding protein [Pseudonocardiaceae bacterium]|nr:NAD(P)H-binding protein [Pseudonocardiaceae bacterium]